MKLNPSILLIPLLVLCSSCDPPNIFLIQNTGASILEVNVSTRYPIRQDSIRFTDSLLEIANVRLSRLPHLLEQSIAVQQIDSQQYTFQIAPRQTFMLTPASIGTPWTSVIARHKDQQIKIIGNEDHLSKNLQLQRRFPNTTLVKIQAPSESKPHP